MDRSQRLVSFPQCHASIIQNCLASLWETVQSSFLFRELYFYTILSISNPARITAIDWQVFFTEWIIPIDQFSVQERTGRLSQPTLVAFLITSSLQAALICDVSPMKSVIGVLSDNFLGIDRFLRRSVSLLLYLQFPITKHIHRFYIHRMWVCK